MNQIRMETIVVLNNIKAKVIGINTNKVISVDIENISCEKHYETHIRT